MNPFKAVTFTLGSLVLEGAAAFAVRACTALLIFLVFWLLSRFIQKKLFPKLQARSWTWRSIPILLNGFSKPLAVLLKVLGFYFALLSLPWSAVIVRQLLLACLRITVTVCICWGLWESADLCELLLSVSKSEFSSNKTIAMLFHKGYKFLVALFGALMIIEETGLPVTGIITGAGLAGLTLSLAAQNSASNLFNGMLILIERPFDVGDWITVEDVSGTVEDITFTSIRVRALDNSLYVVPNSSVCSTTVNNATNRTKRLYRFTLGVLYGTPREPLEQLMADITAMLHARADVYADSITVRLTGFSESSIDILVSAYIKTPDLGPFLDIQNELNLNLIDLMKKNGVHFSLPSTNIYTEKASPAAR